MLNTVAFQRTTMDAKNMHVYPKTQMCAGCMHARKGLRHSIQSKNRLICILFAAVTISMLISIFTVCMYYMMHARVSLQDAAIAKLQTDIQMLKDNGKDSVGTTGIHTERQTSESINMFGGAATVYHVSSPSNGSKTLTLTSKDDQPDSFKHEVVKRQTRGKSPKRKKKQKGMTYIQIEGAGTQKKQKDKNAVTGYWSSPRWLKRGSKRFKDAKKAFKFDDINKNGKLRVKKPGMYLIYAQFTLVGNPITGFHVSLAHSATNTEKLLQCTRFSNTTHAGNTQSCFTMGIVELKSNEEIFIQENHGNEGANYSKISYFGLIRIGD